MKIAHFVVLPLGLIYYRKENHSVLLCMYTIFEDGNVRRDQVGGMEKELKEGTSFLFSVTISLNLGHVFFQTLMCVCVCVCVGSGLSSKRDLAADVTFLPVKATMRASHTLMYVTRQSYRKCVFPFYDSPSVSH